MQSDDGDSAPAVRLNEPAPDFEARSTAGPIRLSDYRGRWLLFFAHPADFTPVCTSEFVAIARAAPRFDAIGCALLALSVDSLYSHIAWLRDIETRLDLSIPFPVVEDPSMAIARAYGMLDPAADSSATVRATFVIDPDGMVRAMIWYPMTVGRSVDELLRVVAALQAADRVQASAPADWRPGEPMLELGATTMDEALARPDGKTPWYLSVRPS
ncbi:MAG: peroxiredoxin [Rhodobacteraceae bacterium]|nr:peroxiredoxin [Paracoccaceae bacterium]